MSKRERETGKTSSLSVGALGVVLSPLRDPLLDPVHVAVHLVGRVALELHDHLLVVRVARLLEQDLHDLRVQVLLQLGLGVFPDKGVRNQVCMPNRTSPVLAPPFSGRGRGRRDGRGKKVTYRADNRSYRVVESTRSTTTRSIQLSGNRSHACQSMIQPPTFASSSMASSSYFDMLAQCTGTRVFPRSLLLLCCPQRSRGMDESWPGRQEHPLPSLPSRLVELDSRASTIV